MKHLKKITAAVLAVMMLMTISACEFHAKNEKVATVSKTDVGSELYLMYLMQADSEFKSQIDEDLTETDQEEITDSSEYYKKTLDGKDAESWIYNKAMVYLKNYAWTVETFESLGLTFDKEDEESVENYVYYYWDYYGGSEQYEAYGISEDAFRLYWSQLVKQEAIFDYYYNEGGVEEVAEADVFKNITENYIEAETITLTKTDSEGNALTGDALTKVQAQAQGYVDRFNAGEATMGELNDEYTGADKETTDSTTSSTTTESTTESTESATESTESTSSDTTSSETEEEEITSVYEDAQFFSSEDSDPTVYNKLKEAIAAEGFVGYNKAAYVETDTSIVVYVIRDMSTDKEFVMDSYKVNALHNLKDTEFEAKMKTGTDAITITVENAIKRYKAKNFVTEE